VTGPVIPQRLAPSADPETTEKQAITPLLEISQAVKRFGPTVALDGVDFGVQPGERVAIVGRSGSGKTTLLRCLNLLETPTSGTLTYAGRVVGSWGGSSATVPSRRELSQHRIQTGMVFQRFELFPHLTAIGNVMLGLRRVRGCSKAEAHERAMEQLKLVGLAERAKAHPHELSGGQQQRVAIARSLAMEPKVMLFDEPTSALDPELVDEVLAVILKLAEQGMTMVAVTHEIAFAHDVATRMVVVDSGGIIEEGAPTDIIQSPVSPVTHSLLRRLRLT
jgi:ABC-type polar amino acid transport system ATPase subunit